jgi:hypothetical protein
VDGIEDAQPRWKDRASNAQLNVETEGLGDGLYELQRRVRLSTLDAPDVARRHAYPGGELLAAHVQAETGLEAGAPEGNPDRHAYS